MRHRGRTDAGRAPKARRRPRDDERPHHRDRFADDHAHMRDAGADQLIGDRGVECASRCEHHDVETVRTAAAQWCGCSDSPGARRRGRLAREWHHQGLPRRPTSRPDDRRSTHRGRAHRACGAAQSRHALRRRQQPGGRLHCRLASAPPDFHPVGDPTVSGPAALRRFGPVAAPWWQSRAAVG
jgi:hypothetical protein